MKHSTRTRVADLLEKPYSRVLIPDAEGGYTAEILEFPGCVAEGDTVQEAFENLERAAESWLAACVERELRVPQPATDQDVSGKFALRLPRSLYARARRAAVRDGVSLNQYVVAAVAERLGGGDVLVRLEKLLAKPVSTPLREVARAKRGR